MSVRLNRRSLLLAASLAPMLSASQIPPEAAAEPIIPATVAGEHLSWVIAQLNDGADSLKPADVTPRFTPLYLDSLSAEDIIETFAILSPRLAPCTVARLEGGATNQHANAMLRTQEGFWRVAVGLEFDAPYRINDFFLEPVIIPELPERPRSWAGIISRFKSIAPQASFIAAEIVNDALVPISSYQPDDSGPIASAFKLFVLGAMVDRISLGELTWGDVITISNDFRSLPSGLLYYEPAGSTFPLEYVAERMIAESDNTATDHVIHHTGREKIEQRLGLLGHSNPEVNMPLYFTREWFAIRMLFSTEEIDDFLDASIPEQRAILIATVDPLAGTLYETDYWPGPAESDRIEWFASVADIARCYVALHRYSTLPGTEQVANALSLEPGIPFDPEDWAYVGFKEGYETGLKVMCWLLQRQDGRWFTLVSRIHDIEQEIDGDTQRSLMVAAANLLARYQG